LLFPEHCLQHLTDTHHLPVAHTDMLTVAGLASLHHSSATFNNM